MRHRVWQIEIGNHGSFFVLLPPPQQPWKSRFKKKKKNYLEMFIILHMYTKNLNHLMYASWDMECDRHNLCTINEHYMMYGSIIWYGAWQTEFCFHFGPFFALLSPPQTTKKTKILKKLKNAWRYYHFTLMYHKWQYDIWFLRYGAQQNFLSFWTIFCPFTPIKPENQNFEKMKKCLEIFSFHTCLP